MQFPCSRPVAGARCRTGFGGRARFILISNFFGARIDYNRDGGWRRRSNWAVCLAAVIFGINAGEPISTSLCVLLAGHVTPGRGAHGAARFGTWLGARCRDRRLRVGPGASAGVAGAGSIRAAVSGLRGGPEPGQRALTASFVLRKNRCRPSGACRRSRGGAPTIGRRTRFYLTSQSALIGGLADRPKNFFGKNFSPQCGRLPSIPGVTLQ